MNKFEFRQKVKISGKIFEVGVRDVPTEVEEHPHFLRFVECGYILEVDAATLVKPETPAVRSARLHASLKAKAEAKAAKEEPKEKPAPPKEEPKPKTPKPQPPKEEPKEPESPVEPEPELPADPVEPDKPLEPEAPKPKEEPSAEPVQDGKNGKTSGGAKKTAAATKEK